MPTPKQSLPESRSLTWIAVAIGVGVLLLGALILRELLFHPTLAHHATPSTVEETSAAVAMPPPVRAAAPTAQPTVAVAPVGTGAAAPAASANLQVPAAAKIIAGVVEDPRAFAPSSGFAPPAIKTETFIYNMLPPFNSTELKRSRTNHNEWELDALRGPKMTDLGPAGGVHEAVTAKDANGTELGTWYVIDSGPLAPAFATQSLQAMRVMSRDYVDANRDLFPKEVTALLDAKK